MGAAVNWTLPPPGSILRGVYPFKHVVVLLFVAHSYVNIEHYHETRIKVLNDTTSTFSVLWVGISMKQMKKGCKPLCALSTTFLYMFKVISSWLRQEYFFFLFICFLDFDQLVYL